MIAVPKMELIIQCGKPPFQDLTPVDLLKQGIGSDIEACRAHNPLDQKQFLTLALTYTMQLVDWNTGHGAKADLICAALMRLQNLPTKRPQPVPCYAKHRKYWEGLLWLVEMLPLKNLPASGGSSSVSGDATHAAQSEDTTLQGMLALCNRNSVDVSPLKIAMDMFHDFITRLKAFCAKIARHIAEARTLLFPHREKMDAISALRKEVNWLQQIQKNMINVSGLHNELPMRTPL